jgi:hypothetical protein
LQLLVLGIPLDVALCRSLPMRETFQIESPPDVVKESVRDGSVVPTNSEEPFFFTWKDFVNRNFYLSGPWTIDYYHTVRGAENFHIYLWIGKDLAWAQDWYWPAMIFGCAALLWCFVLLYHAVHSKNMVEIYMWIAMVLWLGGNFVWMAGRFMGIESLRIINKLTTFPNQIDI